MRCWIADRGWYAGWHTSGFVQIMFHKIDSLDGFPRNYVGSSNAALELDGGLCDLLLAWPRFSGTSRSAAQPVHPTAAFRSKTRRRSREAESPTEDGADYPVDATKQGRTTQQRGGWMLALGRDRK